MVTTRRSTRSNPVDYTPQEHKKKKKKKETLPSARIILRGLLNAYHGVPKRISFFGLDFSFTFAMFISLIFVKEVFFWLLVSLGWPSRSKMTTDAAASLTSILHSSYLCSCLTIFFWNLGWNNYIPSAKMKTTNKKWDDVATACLQLCTGYMLFDSFSLIKDTFVLGLMPLSQFDCIVLLHHFLTSFYMTSCRFVRAGHISAMVLMLTGEITNPLMNGMFVTRFAIQLECCSSDNMLRLHTFLEHAFAFNYLIFRIFIGPVCALHLCWDLIFTKRGRKNIPLPLSLLWVSLVLIVLVGGGPFILEALEMILDGWKLKFDQNYDYGERFKIQKDI